jgi:hypothetical protein
MSNLVASYTLAVAPLFLLPAMKIDAIAVRQAIAEDFQQQGIDGVHSAVGCLGQRESRIASALTTGRRDCSRFFSTIAAVIAMTTAAAIASNNTECRHIRRLHVRYRFDDRGS